MCACMQKFSSKYCYQFLYDNLITKKMFFPAVETMSDISFNLIEIESKPHRKYRKGSKYDPIIDKFCEGKSDLVKVDVPGREANYLRMQLKKRIDARELDKQIEVSVVNNIAYLEKK